MTTKRVKVRDYVTLGEINHGSSGYERSLKDKLKNRKSKQSQRQKQTLKKYLD